MHPPLAAPGRLVAGRYRLRSQLGGGGMGAVWLARDELLGREVAVKQVLITEHEPEVAEQQRQRALREGRIAARLSHPHAISVYDVAQEGTTPWLVMEYLPSRSLAEVLAEDGVLRVDQVAQIGAQVADALTATHAAGIVHRDVKPANVLIGRGERVEGLVKITDFGISHASGDVTLTQTGQITGTPAFLAPEVAQGREMDRASDVFSLGATLYTCLEGRPPFGMEDNALAMLHKVAGGTVRPPTRAGSLSAPLERMLALDPAARPTMAEVRDELARLAAGRSGDTTTVLLARTDLRPGPSSTAALPAAAAAGDAGPSGPIRPAPAPSPRRPGRRRGRWLALAAALLALGVFAGVWAIGPGGADDDPRAGGVTPTSAPTASSTAGTSSPSSSAPPTSSSEAPAPAVPPEEEPAAQTPDEKEVRDFVRDYHRLVIDDPAAAWELTGPTLRQAIGYEGYVQFWNGFDDVKVSGLEMQSPTTALADFELRRPGGERIEEEHLLTFVVGDDGRLLLDSDVAV